MAARVTPTIQIPHSLGSCEWVDCDLEVLWVEVKRILHLKVDCSYFSPVGDRGSLSYLSFLLFALRTFQEVNSQLHAFATSSQIEYEKSLLKRSRENPKLLHSYMRHKKQLHCSVGPLRLVSNVVSDNPKEMADCFLDAFSGIHLTTIPAYQAPHQQCVAVLSDIDFSPADVHATLSSLDPNAAMGQDGLHPCLLKSCAATLSAPLYRIFKQSLLEGVLPLAWKSSLVFPIFKKGSRQDLTNYRPVSLTSVLCKSFKRIIFKGLHTFFSMNQVLTDEQFGF